MRAAARDVRRAAGLSGRGHGRRRGQDSGVVGRQRLSGRMRTVPTML
jgi:hypothetical protein